MNNEHLQNLVGGGQGDEHEHVQSSVVFGGGVRGMPAYHRAFPDMSVN